MARIVVWGARLGLCLAVVAAVLVLLSPIGYRLGWWGVAVALRELVKWSVYLGLAAFVLSAVTLLIGAIRGTAGTATVAVAGLVVSLAASAYPLYQYGKVNRLPRIHDITTDTERPPEFVALAEARKQSPNGLAYKGAEIAVQQKQAYPRIGPLDSKLAPADLYAKTEAAMRALGLRIVDARADQGRIEASTTSVFYGFTDDMVARIEARESGSRLDLRSMSRVGLSDVGVNAQRIQALLDALRANGA